MSDQARRKERQRQKRKSKQEMIRKQNSVSPYKRAAEGRLVACLVNEGWKEKGMADVHVFRTGPNGITGMAVFLVDCWCAGLKDVFGRVGVSLSEALKNTRQSALDAGFKVIEIPIEEAARIVAGGIRFGVQNGFRLPHDFDRWLPFLGPVDWRSADISDFGRENGELLWMGTPHDLQRRLIGGTAEEFLKRPNVKYLMDIGSSDALDRADEIDDLDDASDEADDHGPDDVAARREYCDWIDSTTERLAGEVKQWCIENGKEIDPGVRRVLQLALLKSEGTQFAQQGQFRTNRSPEQLTALFSMLDEAMADEVLGQAWKQVTGYVRWKQESASNVPKSSAATTQGKEMETSAEPIPG